MTWTRFAVLALLAYPAFGAIAHDKSTLVESTANATTCNFQHVPVGTPDLVLVWVGLDADETISNATYGAQSLNLITTSGSAAVASDEKLHLYELHSPPSGEQTVDVDFSQDNHHVCVSQTFTGTDTSDATIEVDADDNAGAPCSTMTTTLTLDSTDSWMATMSLWDGADQDPIAETGLTWRNEGATDSNNTSDDSYGHGESTGDSGSTSHVTDGAAGNDECAQISVEIVEPYAAGDEFMLIGAP